MKRRLTPYIAALLVAGVGRASLAAPAAQFHAPQSAAERALDRIVKRADTDDEQLDNLFHRFGPVPAAKRVDYRAMLSAPLLAAMRGEERRQVQADCGGQYQADGICGLDFSPITCSQDNVPAYQYRTLAATPDTAMIELRWPGEKNIAATYRLKRMDGAWKIDGVACDGGVRFNFG